MLILQPMEKKIFIARVPYPCFDTNNIVGSTKVCKCSQTRSFCYTYPLGLHDNFHSMHLKEETKQ